MSSVARRSSLLRLALPALAMIGGGASSALALDVYTIGSTFDVSGNQTGSTLLKYSTTNQGTVTTIPLSGFLDSIDSRPATGQLYGYYSGTNAYYTINTTTGALTTVSAATVGPGSSSLVNGIDFNATIDRLRLVSDGGDNIVFNPATGTTTAATTLAYAPGDVNFGATPSVNDNAYTNSYAGATTTTQYVIDYNLNSLAILNNNTGQLSTVAPITLNGSTFNFDNFSGFDIYTDANKSNIAYAQFYDGTSDGLYTINLASGAATLVGLVNDANEGFGYSLAVVPEPTSIAALAGLALAATRRRR